MMLRKISIINLATSLTLKFDDIFPARSSMVKKLPSNSSQDKVRVGARRQELPRRAFAVIGDDGARMEMPQGWILGTSCVAPRWVCKLSKRNGGEKLILSLRCPRR